MSEAIAAPRPTPIPRAASVLKWAAIAWFAVATAGQMAFVYFIAVFYLPPTLQGQFEAWNRRDLITGYVPGDHAGNLQFAAHVLLGGLITAAGIVQFIPQIRTYAPALHRWTGRLYIVTAFLTAAGGLWLVWGRGTYLTLFGAVSVSILAGLILLSAAMTLRHAMARRIALHRRWALRLFLVVSGVWFQRVGYMAWIILNQGPVGIGPRMDGPFDIVWGFGIFVLPLATLELYFLARDRGGPMAKSVMAGVLVLLTGVMAVGIAGTVLLMWRPFL
jgi:hypothetical protein